MATPSANTFIVDCPQCKAKVAAIEQGLAERSGNDDETGEPYGERLHVGVCPRCDSLLAGVSYQIGFEGIDSEYNTWRDVVRVFPKPPKIFNSSRIPRIVKDSLLEADRSLQANANIAACVMLGRAFEAVCRDLLQPVPSKQSTADARTSSMRPIMLGEGILKLKEKNLIDERLFDWSQQLQAFRNIAAHPTEESISREDAEDLHTFVYAIIEYIYDLTDRYNEFKERIADRAAQKAKKKK